ncbi:MAG: M48 family metalloprotease [Myxococcota bacterium]|nr:M48 family metalloprotease [Myxococcota bacterium]
MRPHPLLLALSTCFFALPAQAQALWATDIDRPSDFVFDSSICAQPALLSDIFKDIGFGIQEELTQMTSPAMSDDDERAFGRELHAFLSTQVFTGGYPGAEAYVDALLAQITPYTTRRLAWRSFVYDDPTPNAYAVPGGFVYVSTGLFEMLSNEAQLVAVLAHELGHHELRHSILHFQYLKTLGVLDPLSQPSLAQGALEALETPFVSRQEREADAFAINVVFELGYSPQQMVALMLAMDEAFYADLDMDESSFVSFLLPELTNLLESHPRPKTRACTMWSEIELRLEANSDEVYYVGTRNYQEGIPRSQVVY